MSRGRARAFSGAVVLALVAMAAWTALRLEVTTAITHFLPEGEDRELVALSHALSESDATRTIVVTIGAPDRASAAAASRALASRLDRLREIEKIVGGVDPRVEEAVRRVYFPRRLALLTDRPETLRGRLSDEGLREAARELKSELALPTGALVRAIAPEDPLLAFPAILERLRSARLGDLAIEEGRLVTRDGRHAVLFVTTRGSPFDAKTQRAVQRRIASAFDAVKREVGGALTLEQSGVGRFAIHAEQSIRADITRISIVSTAGVLALFLGLYRSLRAVVLAFVPVGAGVVTAAFVSTLAFGRIHGLTLAFGATLVGVCVDYAVHAITHHAMSDAGGGGDPAAVLARIWPGLVLGCVTTAAGLAGLAWTTFPGMREIAVFASVGVGAALLATRWIVPAWLPVRPAPVALQRRLGGWLARVLEAASRRRGMLALAWMAAVVLAAIGIPRLAWIDDLRALSPLDERLLAEDTRVRGRVSRMEAGRMVVAFGDDEEQALERNARAFAALEEAREAGELEDFRSLHALVWPESLQRANVDALRRSRDLAARLDGAFVAEGFRTGSFAPFAEAIRTAPEPLRIDDLRRSALADLVRPFVVEVEGRVAVLTHVRHVVEPAALERRLDVIDGVRYFDQSAFLASAYGRYRARALELVAWGLLAVLAIVALRYRRPAPTLAAVLPAVCAGAATLGVLGLFGMHANILHVVAVLLVTSIGADYGVFIVEQHRRGEHDLPATLLSILVACLTTVLSFGLLALSQSPALRAVGVTVAVGVVSALILAPAGVVLLGPPRSRS